MSLHIHCLQHIPFETPGYIAQWVRERNHTISYTRLFEPHHAFPDPGTIDWLLIMGGAMAAYEEDAFPFLKSEKHFISDCIGAGKVVIGICLGSQLLADCLGAKVYPNKQKEIGFLPVLLQQAATAHPLFKGFPEMLNLFQWHGDTFDLPDGATLLASSEACKNQAFIKGKCIGMQFHWEADSNIICSMLEADRHELEPAPYVHSEEKIKANLSNAADLKPLLFQFLDRLAYL